MRSRYRGRYRLYVPPSQDEIERNRRERALQFRLLRISRLGLKPVVMMSFKEDHDLNFFDKVALGLAKPLVHQRPAEAYRIKDWTEFKRETDEDRLERLAERSQAICAIRMRVDQVT